MKNFNIILSLPIILSFSTILFAQENTIEKLRLASWNTRWQSEEDIAKGDSWSKRVKPISDIIRFYDFDIICIQENSAGKQRDLAPYLKDYNFIQNDSMEYNPILVKKDFQVLEKGRFYLSKTPWKKSKSWDSKHARYCTWAKIRKDNRIFFVFNTHFDYHGKNAKIESAKLMNKIIPNMTNGSPYFLAGDFNSTENSQAYNILVSSPNIKDAKLLATFVYQPKKSYNYFDPNRFSKWDLDHIFVGPNITIHRYGVLNETYYDGEIYRYPSDHLPVMIIANFKISQKK